MPIVASPSPVARLEARDALKRIAADAQAADLLLASVEGGRTTMARCTFWHRVGRARVWAREIEQDDTRSPRCLSRQPRSIGRKSGRRCRFATPSVRYHPISWWLLLHAWSEEQKKLAFAPNLGNDGAPMLLGSPSTVSLPRIDAETYYRDMTSGRNGAVLLGGATLSGRIVDVVVKLSDRLRGYAPVPYLTEWLAAAIGQRLGINVPEPFEVVITPEFGKSLRDPIRTSVMKSVGSAFGCRFFPHFTQWMKGQLLPMELRQAAADLLAFDVFIHNVDRRADNPNLLVSRQVILAIDHDAAFSFIVPTIGSTTDPANDKLLDSVISRHVLNGMFGNKTPSLDRFRAAVLALDDTALDEIAAATPASWQTGLATGKLDEIIGVIRRRRDAIDQWLPPVEACIQG